MDAEQIESEAAEVSTAYGYLRRALWSLQMGKGNKTTAIEGWR